MDKSIITHDLPLSINDYNDSFARYMNNMAPQLVHETSDISCISKVTNGRSVTKTPIHCDIAEELNNYDAI